MSFDRSIDEIMARDRVGMKKAKGLIYDFILAQNPGTKRVALYKKIERARKIYRLKEKIGLDKIIYIQCKLYFEIYQRGNSKSHRSLYRKSRYGIH